MSPPRPPTLPRSSLRLQAPRQATGPTYRFAPQNTTPSPAAQIANAADRARASQTGGPGKPLTLPHDFSGFDKTFSQPNADEVAARHPNIQTTSNIPTSNDRPTNVNSEAVQSALDAAEGNGTVNHTPTGNLLASDHGMGHSTFVPRGTPQPTAEETAAATTSTGVVHAPPWVAQVLKDHPEIGQKDSEGNKAFVSAYQDAMSKQGEGKFDPAALAQSTMKPIYAQRAKDAGESAFGTSADIDQLNSNIAQQRSDAAADNAQKSAAEQSAANARATASGPAPGSLPATLNRGEQAVNDAEANTANAMIDATNATGRWLTGSRASSLTPDSPNGSNWDHTTVPPGTGAKIAQQVFPGSRDGSRIAAQQQNPPAPANPEIVQAAPQTPPPDASAPDTTPNLARGFRFPNYADGAYGNASSLTPGVGSAGNYEPNGTAQAADTLSYDNLLQTPTAQSVAGPAANGSTKNLSSDNQSAVASWNSGQKEADASVRSNFKAAGLSDPDISASVLNVPGGGTVVAPGSLGAPSSSGNSSAGISSVPRYAKGIIPKPFQFRGQEPTPMQAAMQREKTAIAHHVGGAKMGDKPEPVNLPNIGPAVVNSGEKIVPNAAGGTAVLTRRMQRKPFKFGPR